MYHIFLKVGQHNPLAMSLQETTIKQYVDAALIRSKWMVSTYDIDIHIYFNSEDVSYFNGKLKT